MSLPVKAEIRIVYKDGTEVLLVIDEQVEIEQSSFSVMLYPEQTKPQFSLLVSGRGRQRIVEYDDDLLHHVHDANQLALEGFDE